MLGVLYLRGIPYGLGVRSKLLLNVSVCMSVYRIHNEITMPAKHINTLKHINVNRLNTHTSNSICVWICVSVWGWKDCASNVAGGKEMLASGVNWRAAVCVRAGVWQIGWRKNVSGVATEHHHDDDDDGCTPEVLCMRIICSQCDDVNIHKSLSSASPPRST